MLKKISNKNLNEAIFFEWFQEDSGNSGQKQLNKLLHAAHIVFRQ